jgi:hypothetical protein
MDNFKAQLSNEIVRKQRDLDGLKRVYTQLYEPTESKPAPARRRRARKSASAPDRAAPMPAADGSAPAPEPEPVAVKQPRRGQTAGERIDWSAIYKRVPDSFTNAEAHALAPGRDHSEVHAAIERWIKNGLVAKQSRGRYRKVAASKSNGAMAPQAHDNGVGASAAAE